MLVTRLWKVGLSSAVFVFLGAGVTAGVKWLGAPPQRLIAAAPVDQRSEQGATHQIPEKKAAAKLRRLPRGSHAAREIHEVTIKGRAHDTAGNPVAGATIQVTNANSSRMNNEEEIWGRTTTRADGTYVLERVPVVVLTADPGPIPKPTEGAFEVAGWAPEHAFTWHERQRPLPASALFQCSQV